MAKTEIEINTRATVRNGAISCDATTDSETLALRDSANHWRLDVNVADVLSIIEALGGAYDWRKRRLLERQP